MSLIPWRNKRAERDEGDLVESTSIARFRDEMDRVFDRFFRDPWLASRDLFAPAGAWSPRVELSETDQEIVVRAELPGVDPKQIDITVTGDTLTISGEKKESRHEERGGATYSERRFGSFRRSIQLPSTADPEKVKAEHAHGVVTIHLGKVPGAAPRRVPVAVAKE
jgi:HSP20 family protein